MDEIQEIEIVYLILYSRQVMGAGMQPGGVGGGGVGSGGLGGGVGAGVQPGGVGGGGHFMVRRQVSYRDIEEEFIHKRRPRSLLLLGGRTI